MKFFMFVTLLGVAFFGYGQPIPKSKYWVQFKDKAGTPYSLYRPYEFLSPRAVARRVKFGIPITVDDFPVNAGYLRSLRSRGVQIHGTSRWLNAATIVATEDQMKQVKALEIVESSEYLGRHIEKQIFLRKEHKQRDSLDGYSKTDHYYGAARPQIQTINAHLLHQLGYQGQGKLIAILDGGFTNVDIMPFFDSVRVKNNFLPGYDFVDNDNYYYESSSHGSHVLSVMAANLPGLMVGSAPQAQYLCIKTEDTRVEYLVEEANWIAGAEFADSIGADIINSSLGYTTFSDSKMNYNFEDLDGRSSRATRAADIAFSKGIIIINSAGNSGASDWRYVGVPADGFRVLAVGATRSDGRKASFSSSGPTADGRIKPNISAPGQGVAVASIYSYEVERSNGTSLASPLIAGAVAALWSAFPDLSHFQIYDAIEQSADQFTDADLELGHGIPNFFKAYLSLRALQNAVLVNEGEKIKVFNNRTEKGLEVILKGWNSGRAKLRLTDAVGKQLLANDLFIRDQEANRYLFKAITLSPGWYHLEIVNQSASFNVKFIN